ncbi:MAG: hypothetical protein J6P07_05015 [Spirochaetaceae bacterium]|nr:hypothetical protein [Spirochaetaceae bacterium]MBO7731915.1 hypothetical protein [Methanobrevibacter sp.]
MSTQVLGDVQLVTKQEVEAMLDATVIPEEVIDDKVNAEKSARELAENILRTALESERTQREADKLELDDKISDEAEIRSREDAALRTEIEQEASVRQQADTDIVNAIDEMRQFEEEHYPNSYAQRLKGLPIAILTVHNTDKSLHVGDTITTVDEKFFPKQAVDFWMDVEQLDGTGASKTCWIHCRLDNNGNVTVINIFDFAGATSATDTYTVMYLTEK